MEYGLTKLALFGLGQKPTVPTPWPTDYVGELRHSANIHKERAKWIEDDFKGNHPHVDFDPQSLPEEDFHRYGDHTRQHHYYNYLADKHIAGNPSDMHFDDSPFRNQVHKASQPAAKPAVPVAAPEIKAPTAAGKPMKGKLALLGAGVLGAGALMHHKPTEPRPPAANDYAAPGWMKQAREELEAGAARLEKLASKEQQG